MFSRTANYKRRPAWARYGVAVASVVLGWVAREAMSPVVGETALPFIFFFPAAALAAWYGGFGPGLLAAALSVVAANWFFIEPVHSWSIHKARDLAASGAFFISCLFIVGAMEAMHRARASAVAELVERERAEAELARLREQFAKTVGGVANVPSATRASDRVPVLKATAEEGKSGARLVAVLFAAALFCSSPARSLSIAWVTFGLTPRTASRASCWCCNSLTISFHH